MNAFLRTLGTSFATLAVILFALFSVSTLVHADATSTVEAEIDAHNQQISSLQTEIAGYQKQLDTISTQKQTLQTSLKSIAITQTKTVAQISQIQDQIATANLNLQKLGGLIQTKQQQIDADKQELASSLRDIDNTDQTPLLATLFTSDNFIDAWKDVDSEIQLDEALQSNEQSLSSDTVQLAGQQTQVSTTKDQLTTDNTSLVTQNGSLAATAAAKKELLAETSSKQSSYQSLIATKKAQEQSFENELSTLEDSLKNISPSSVPAAGAGILQWPISADEQAHCVSIQAALGNPYCITQYFGNTPFATANAAIYSGMGHDGVDIGVPIGTPVHAALTGTIAGTGDTDLIHDAAGDQCYSFGKWIMIQHGNGLNTMYAHLSVISVSKGQQVNTGDVIGYSGMTGYATGPHIHFGVYATAGVQYLTLGAFHGTKTPCSNATMPVAPADAYLNPLSYLL
jgi:murein DD-endopeptidase MepM/ murein hydrolase activator NlpD